MSAKNFIKYATFLPKFYAAETLNQIRKYLLAYIQIQYLRLVKLQ